MYLHFISCCVIHKLFSTSEEQESENTFLSNASRFQKEHGFSEGSHAFPLCPSGNSKMSSKITGGNRSTRRKSCPNTTLFTTNLTYSDLELKLGLRGKWLAVNSLSHVMYKNIARTSRRTNWSATRRSI